MQKKSSMIYMKDFFEFKKKIIVFERKQMKVDI